MRRIRHPGSKIASVVVACLLVSSWQAIAPGAGAAAIKEVLLEAPGFDCGVSGGTGAFGTIKYNANVKKGIIKASFKASGLTPGEVVDVYLDQCNTTSGFAFDIASFPALVASSKGVVKGKVSVLIAAGAISYFVCLERAASEIGTDPIPLPP